MSENQQDDLSRLSNIDNLPFFTTGAEGTQERSGKGEEAWVAKAATHLTRAGKRAAEDHRAATPNNPTSRKVTTPAPVSPIVTTPVDEARAASLEERSRLPWEDVTEIRDEVSRMLAERLVEEPGLSEARREAIATEFVDDRIRTRVDAQTRSGERGSSARWDRPKQQTIRQAVLDAQFRLGRLQPLVDEPGVENIHINGHDDVWLSYADGTISRYPFAVAENDHELMMEINFLATRSGSGARSFTSANPRLHLDLPGGARLAAVAPPVAVRPTVVIRIHRLVDITLRALVERDTLSPDAADFLEAAVKAGRSIVTSGFPGAGKTTLLRALADCIPSDEKLVTIEMERELYLDRMPERHPRVTSLEYQPGGGEPLLDGRLAGEVTLEDLVYDTLRLDTQRFVVGEVRGSEIVAMMQAMQSGVGSLSTLHAAGADDAIDRMSSLMLSRGANTTPVYAYRMIEQNIDLIVQIAKFTDPVSGKPKRAVTEIAEIQPGESANGSRPVASPIFTYDKRIASLRFDTRPSPNLLGSLEDVGYDAAKLRGGES